MLHLQCENNEADQTHKHHGNGIVEVPTEATQQCRQQQELQQNQLNILATFLRGERMSEDGGHCFFEQEQKLCADAIK